MNDSRQPLISGTIFLVCGGEEEAFSLGRSGEDFDMFFWRTLVVVMVRLRLALLLLAFSLGM